MSLNHHILAKATTDAVLMKFKMLEWTYLDGSGKDFYRIGTSAEFPSPDAAFYDPVNKVIASFEFILMNGSICQPKCITKDRQPYSWHEQVDKFWRS